MNLDNFPDILQGVHKSWCWVAAALAVATYYECLPYAIATAQESDRLCVTAGIVLGGCDCCSEESLSSSTCNEANVITSAFAQLNLLDMNSITISQPVDLVVRFNANAPVTMRRDESGAIYHYINLVKYDPVSQTVGCMDPLTGYTGLAFSEIINSDQNVFYCKI